MHNDFLEGKKKAGSIGKEAFIKDEVSVVGVRHLRRNLDAIRSNACNRLFIITVLSQANPLLFLSTIVA